MVCCHGITHLSSPLLYNAGKWRFRTSFALDGRLSGKFTSNSTTKSPLWSGFLGKGSPCPATVFLIPGLMTSVTFRLHVFPSIVDTVTEQPHNDWNEKKPQCETSMYGPQYRNCFPNGNLWISFRKALLHFLFSTVVHSTAPRSNVVATCTTTF